MKTKINLGLNFTLIYGYGVNGYLTRMDNFKPKLIAGAKTDAKISIIDIPLYNHSNNN